MQVRSSSEHTPPKPYYIISASHSETSSPLGMDFEVENVTPTRSISRCIGRFSSYPET